MNKISKKIVALVTMAAFVLTLVPFAAFGATSSVDWSNSYILTSEKNVIVDVNDSVDLEMEVVNNSGNPVTEGDEQPVYLWVEDENGITTYATFSYGAGNTAISNVVLDNGYGVRLAKGYDGRDDLHVSISKAGTYTIHAGITLNNEVADSLTDIKELGTVEGQNTIEVEAPAVEVKGITVDSVTGTGITESVVAGEKSGTIDMGTFLTNNTATATVKGTATTDAGVAKNTTFKVSTNMSGLNLSTNEVTTDRNGNFEFTFTMSRAADYRIYIENADYKYTLYVERAENADVDGITTTVDNGCVLEAEKADIDFSDAVQFTITDENGAKLSDALGQPAETPDKDYVGIVSKPERSRLTATDIALYWDDTAKVYTLDYKGTDAEHDLIAGEYTVSIALTSGKSAEATFTLAEYGDPVDVAVELTGSQTGTLEDTVVAGEKVTGKVYLVDENGIKQELSSYYSSVVGDAADKINVLSFDVVAGDDNKYIGSEITVTVFDPDKGFMSSKTLTVVDGKTTNTLSFDSENGAANANNTVNVSVVDENGDVVKNVSGEMYAYVSSQSNEDANVEVTPVDVTNGKGKLTIFSDKETTVDIVVAVVDPAADNKNTAIYAKTLEYTVGEESEIPADTSVVMTIGSSDMVVNNQVVAMEDAAPYVANDRTYVPFRALGEALGAEVEWDNDARTVTYTLGKTEVVMTIGETTYTVNGEEQTMDVAPEISGDRTYVPVRFVGEALGFKVTALYAADGTTASVVFQK